MHFRFQFTIAKSDARRQAKCNKKKKISKNFHNCIWKWIVSGIIDGIVSGRNSRNLEKREKKTWCSTVEPNAIAGASSPAFKEL